MYLLPLVLLANLVTRAVAIGLGAWLSFRLLKRIGADLVALACGLLLGISTLHLLPEAFEMAEPENLGWAMLVTVVVFVILERILHGMGGHEHAGENCACGSHHHDNTQAIPLLAGLSLHNTVDGVLVATSFVASPTLGWIVALAIMGHEIPQSAASLAILKRLGFSEKRAIFSILGVAMFALVGSMIGLWAIGLSNAFIPYAMAVSGTSFLFIVLSHLLPTVLSDVKTKAFRAIGMVILGTVLSFALLHFGGHHHHHGGEDGHHHHHHHGAMIDDNHDHDGHGHGDADHDHDHDGHEHGDADHDHDHDGHEHGDADHDHDHDGHEHGDADHDHDHDGHEHGDADHDHDHDGHEHGDADHDHDHDGHEHGDADHDHDHDGHEHSDADHDHDHEKEAQH